MDLLSSIVDATLAWTGAVVMLGMGMWTVFHTGIPSDTRSADQMTRSEGGLRQAA